MRNRINSDIRKGNVRNLRHLAGYLRPYKKLIIAVFISLVVSSTAVLSMGVGVRYLVDNGFSSGNSSLLDNALLILLGITVVLALSSFARFSLITRLGERVIADIRRDIFRKLVNISPGFFETTRTGEVLSRITTDTTVLQIVIGSSVAVALRNILLLTGGITLLIMTSPKLAGYIAVMIPLIILPILLLGRKVRHLARRAQKKVAELSSNVEEALYGIKTVQAYNRQQSEYERFSGRVQAAFDAAMDRVRVRAVLTALVILLAFGSVGVILWLGGHEVLAGNMSAGELSSFVFYSLVVAGAFGAISEVIGDIQRAAGSAEGLLEILNAKSVVNNPEQPVMFPDKAKAAVEFDNVVFHYPTRQDIAAIAEVSFRVAEGETVALVGPSGAGKSTILQLLLRFYDPDSGVIKLDDIDIRELDLQDLRNMFAYVPQEPVIFSASARDNIAYGRKGATESEIMEAAKIARAMDFIESLPEGMDSFLGEKGVRLSGGERQRIAIARAVLRNPGILLLDEATSALDSENEKLVQDALDEAMQDRTTIVIAHRLSTVQKADRIIVINNGRIETEGTHKQLMKKDNLYKRLAEIQFSGE